MNVTAILPTKNEEKAVGKVIKSLKKYVDEIYIVDYNSTDKTREIAKNLGAKVIIEPRKGYGRAYKTGFKKVRADIIVTLDADGSYSVKNLSSYIQLIKKGEFDFISCNRVPKKGSMSFTHRIGNLILTVFSNILFGISLKDSQSGMWIFKSKILRNLKLESDGMPFSEEIKIKVIKAGFRFAERPVDYYKRLGDVKLNTFRDGLNNLLFLFKLRFNFKPQP
jgi:hypothetical protein